MSQLVELLNWVGVSEFDVVLAALVDEEGKFIIGLVAPLDQLDVWQVEDLLVSVHVYEVGHVALAQNVDDGLLVVLRHDHFVQVHVLATKYRHFHDLQIYVFLTILTLSIE